jgi:hypothetical protein
LRALKATRPRASSSSASLPRMASLCFITRPDRRPDFERIGSASAALLSPTFAAEHEIWLRPLLT